MNLRSVRPGDVVLCDVRGRRFDAEVKHVRPYEVDISPVTRGINYYRINSRQIVRVIAKGGQ